MKLPILKFSMLLLIGLAGGFFALGGLFGPSDYDDCIIEGMQGVQSDRAANLIAASCFEKFSVTEDESPGVELTPAEIANIQLNGGDWTSTFAPDLIRISIYNGNNFGIKNVVLEIAEKGNTKNRLTFEEAKELDPNICNIKTHCILRNSLELNFQRDCIASKTSVAASARAYQKRSDSYFTSKVLAAEKC